MTDNQDNYPTDFAGEIELSELELQYIETWHQEPHLTIAQLDLAISAPTFYYPFKGSYPVTQGYHQGHPAYDWATPNGTPLYAMAKGQITFMGYSQYYANNIRIIFPEQNLMSLYAHQPTKKPWADGIKVGSWVEPKQHVGFSHNTGNSTGPHLHCAVRRPPYAGYANCVNYYPYETLAGSSELGTVAAALELARTQLALQALDAGADGRLRDMQALRCGNETAGSGDGQEGAGEFDIHIALYIGFFDIR